MGPEASSVPPAPAISPPTLKVATSTNLPPAATNANTVLCSSNLDYIKSGNLCTYSPPLDTSDCCLSFAPTGECQECAPGLVAQDGTCKDLKIVGCLVKSNTGSCLNCAIEYELYGGQCFKKIAGCSKYASTGLCTKCSDKYSLDRGLCVPLVIYDEGCHYPFILSPDGTCSIPGCSSTFDYGCADCIDGFSLLPDGSCQKGVIEGC